MTFSAHKMSKVNQEFRDPLVGTLSGNSGNENRFGIWTLFRQPDRLDVAAVKNDLHFRVTDGRQSPFFGRSVPGFFGNPTSGDTIIDADCSVRAARLSVWLTVMPKKTIRFVMVVLPPRIAIEVAGSSGGFKGFIDFDFQS